MQPKSRGIIPTIQELDIPFTGDMLLVGLPNEGKISSSRAVLRSKNWPNLLSQPDLVSKL
jgi:hypothetical protein